MKNKKPKNNTVIIIDGNNMAHRARHKFQLSNRGVDVSVTFGFLRMLITAIHKFDATSVIVCWDGGVPEFRRQAIPEYKANRHKDEDPLAWKDFNRQMDELIDYAIPMFGIPSIKRRGVEADDLLYHSSRMVEGDIVLISSDKDIIQCVSDSVSVWSPSKELMYTPDVVLKEFGVSHADYVHWRALQGDSSDNIQGVCGIGEKIATKLFQEFGSLVGIENAASGRNPVGVLSPKIATSILSFGSERIVKNVYVMALYKDRLGSRRAIAEELYREYTCSRSRIISYLVKNAFVSLLDQLPGTMAKLSVPILKKDIRIPNVGRRFPI